MNKLRIFIALALAGAVAAASDTSTILAEIRDLKSSIEASTTEHWESLQSLRFHLLSTRKGLKTALDSIESLKSQLGQQCSGSLQPSGERGPDVHPRLRGPYQMYYDPHAATVQPLFYDERGTLQPFFIFQTSDRPWAPGSRRTSSAPWNRRWRTTTREALQLQTMKVSFVKQLLMKLYMYFSVYCQLKCSTLLKFRQKFVLSKRVFIILQTDIKFFYILPFCI